MLKIEKLSKEETVRLRNNHVAACVELFFKDDPLKIVRGAGQYMFDEKGNKYLDCINNVAHGWYFILIFLRVLLSHGH